MASGASTAAAVVGSGLVGLAIGSFLNVVAYRVPRHLSVVRPASHCPSCRSPLTAVDTVPVVSWVLLGGRCRRCQAPVSARYPLVEALTGAVFAGLAGALGGLAPLPSVALVVACAIAAALVDLERTSVPPLLGAVAAFGACSLVAVAVATGQTGRVGWAVAGAMACGAAALAGDRVWPRPADAAVLTMAAPTAAGRWLVVVALGWTAGWLWPLGGPIAALMVVAGAVAGRLLPGATGRWSPPLWAVGSVAVAVLFVSGVVGRP